MRAEAEILESGFRREDEVILFQPFDDYLMLLNIAIESFALSNAALRA
jgi:hypothetical protein